jgi:hypothetical protein
VFYIDSLLIVTIAISQLTTFQHSFHSIVSPEVPKVVRKLTLLVSHKCHKSSHHHLFNVQSLNAPGYHPPTLISTLDKHPELTLPQVTIDC